jgi:hypothetical protein
VTDDDIDRIIRLINPTTFYVFLILYLAICILAG